MLSDHWPFIAYCIHYMYDKVLKLSVRNFTFSSLCTKTQSDSSSNLAWTMDGKHRFM